MVMPKEIISMHLREATSDDIPVLATHHRDMFEDIWKQKGEKLEPNTANEIKTVYTEKLKREIASGGCRAWVIEHNGDIIASGAVTVTSSVPNPLDITYQSAYLHSMFTEAPYRNQNCAQRIVHAIIEHCKSSGIKRILLNASEAGKPVYEKFGFRTAPDVMRLFIKTGSELNGK